MGLHVKNFVKIKASPPKNSIFFHSTPKGILDFYILHSLLKKKTNKQTQRKQGFQKHFQSLYLNKKSCCCLYFIEVLFMFLLSLIILQGVVPFFVK